MRRACGVAILGVVFACQSPGEEESDAGDTSGSGVGDPAGSEETDGTDTGGDGDGDGDGDEVGELLDMPPPPFTCDAAEATSPKLDAVLSFDPAEPHPGDTLTVIARARNGTSRQDAPPMSLSMESAQGQASHEAQTIEGGAALYYYAIPDVPLGDLCLLSTIDGDPEVAGKVTVTPRPPSPPSEDGVFKVVSNHQWTCGEQPGWGNEIHVRVEDENGAGIVGAVIEVGLADTTDHDSIYNDGEEIPTELVTDESGNAMFFNYWPISDNGLLVFKLSVAGVASDVATEITTGWWEDDLMGCKYCQEPTVNTWGHWSYDVVFRRDAGAAEACVVENDHAGMQACGEPRHIHHHPEQRACWSVP